MYVKKTGNKPRKAHVHRKTHKQTSKKKKKLDTDAVASL